MNLRLMWISLGFVLLVTGSIVAMRSSVGAPAGEAAPTVSGSEAKAAPSDAEEAPAPVEEPSRIEEPSVTEEPSARAQSAVTEPSSARRERSEPPQALAALQAELESFATQSKPPRSGDKQPTEDQMAQAFDMLSRMLGLPDVTPQELKQRVEAVGGLRFMRDVPIDFMTREGLARYIRDLFEAEYPVDFAEKEERMMRGFGFLPPGDDLRTIRERVLNENIAGFYDERPGVKKLFAISSGKSLNLMNQLVLAHELRHAIQDQHFNIGDSLAVKSDYDDRRVAALALIEGDATLVMEKYMMSGAPGMESLLGGLGNMGSSMDSSMAEMFAGPALREAPPIVKEQLVSPYLVGRELANAIFARGGFRLLNEKLGSLPRSMEQVLHPAKYLDQKDEPIPVASPAEGGSPESEGRLGELFIRVLLEAGVEAPVAARAAAGWGGDAYAVWKDGEGRYRLTWKTVWDSEPDAREFFESLSELAKARFGAGSVTPALLSLKSPDGTTTVLRLSGREVVFERAGFP